MICNVKKECLNVFGEVDAFSLPLRGGRRLKEQESPEAVFPEAASPEATSPEAVSPAACFQNYLPVCPGMQILRHHKKLSNPHHFHMPL